MAETGTTWTPAEVLTLAWVALHPVTAVYNALGAEPIELIAVGLAESVVLGLPVALFVSYQGVTMSGPPPKPELRMDGFEVTWRSDPRARLEDAALPAFSTGLIAGAGGLFWLSASLWMNPRVPDAPFAVLVFSVGLSVALAIAQFMPVWILRAVCNGVRSGAETTVSLRGRELTVNGTEWLLHHEDDVQCTDAALVLSRGDRRLAVRGGSSELSWLQTTLASVRPGPEEESVPGDLRELLGEGSG